MNLSQFDYNLPTELIAQEPLVERETSRMMILKRKEGSIAQRFFYDIDSYLQAGDVLVVNDSKVIPARLTGVKATGGMIEMLLLSRKIDSACEKETVWDVLLKPAKRIREGNRILFGNMGEAQVIERLTDKKWRLAFSTPGSFEDFLQVAGAAPLPPYIKRKGKSPGPMNDLARYQTIYARVPGSVAAPTAGFHFSHQVLDKINKKSASVVSVTLHVGYGTFSPIEVDEVENHVMESEWFELTAEAAGKINEAKRVIAVGTTATRVLESAADEAGIVKPTTGTTNLFISPGYRFKRVDALLTNFHLPKSSLFLLASAFAGLPLLHQAYQTAIENRYRFYSYGDCTLIL